LAASVGGPFILILFVIGPTSFTVLQ
jgi:hypothetical protein